MKNVFKMFLSIVAILAGGLAMWLPDQINVFVLGLMITFFGVFILMESLEEVSQKERDLKSPKGRAEWCKAHNLPPHYLLATEEEIAVLRAEIKANHLTEEEKVAGLDGK